MPTPPNTIQSLFIDNHSRGKIGDFLREPRTASISEALNRKFNKNRIFDENRYDVMRLQGAQKLTGAFRMAADGFNITLYPESLQESYQEAPCGVCELHERPVS